ncbi:MAG: MFS transporter, partial [Desulfobulbus sp.]|nr:MFS transporter [Desulfobulbus sp.]
IGVGFAALIGQARAGLTAAHPDWSASLVQAGAFRTAFAWLPGYLVLGLLLVALVCLPRLRRRDGAAAE